MAKLTRPFWMPKKVFQSKVLTAERRLGFAMQVLKGKRVAFGNLEQHSFSSRDEFDSFVREIVSTNWHAFNPNHHYSYEQWPDCYQRIGIRLRKWRVEIHVEYIQISQNQKYIPINLGWV